MCPERGRIPIPYTFTTARESRIRALLSVNPNGSSNSHIGLYWRDPQGRSQSQFIRDGSSFEMVGPPATYEVYFGPLFDCAAGTSWSVVLGARAMNRQLTARLVGVAYTTLILTSFGCSDSATAPSSANSGTQATISSVSVTGLPLTFSVGDSAQLVVRATWTDGRTEDVTARARLTSRSLSCVVTPAGLVSALEPGDCSVTATVETSTGVANVVVGASAFVTFSGIIRERFESGEPPIPGAVVTVRSGPEAGRRIVADDRGRYVLERMPRAPITAEFGGMGFESQPIALSPDSPSRDVLLAPEDVLIEWSDRPGLPGDRVTFPFVVTHRGPFVLSTRSEGFECGTYETFGAFIRNVDKGEFVAYNYPCTPGVVSSTSGFLERGHYEFVASTQFGLGGTDRSASLTHPR